MSAKTVRARPGARRLAVRIGLVVVYALSLVLVFVTGKGHTVLIDNKDRPEGFAALDGVLVSVNGGEPLELYAGDRDMVRLKGQRHRVSVESFDGGDRKETSMRLPMDADMLLLSVPRLAAGEEVFLEPFAPRDQSPPSDEPVGNTNAFTSPEAGELPAEPPPEAEPPAQ